MMGRFKNAWLAEFLDRSYFVEIQHTRLIYYLFYLLLVVKSPQ